MAGEGIPHVAPVMQGNAALINSDAFNFIKVVLEGYPRKLLRVMNACTPCPDSPNSSATSRSRNCPTGLADNGADSRPTYPSRR